MSQENIYLCKTDYQLITALLEKTDADVADALWQELDRAMIVDNDALPANTVCMNAIVEFIDRDTQQPSRVQLVYPPQADIASGRISILAPVGAALIGLSVGQRIDWPLANGKARSLQVVAVHPPTDVE
jgi:regulator of nucleoside diphosphate kinase